MEAKHQLDVLDRRLEANEYIAGSNYTIADIAVWPWYAGLTKGWLYQAAEFLQAQEYGNVGRRTRSASGRPSSAGEWSTASLANSPVSCTRAMTPAILRRKRGRNRRREVSNSGIGRAPAVARGFVDQVRRCRRNLLTRRRRYRPDRRRRAPSAWMAAPSKAGLPVSEPDIGSRRRASSSLSAAPP
jgi:hypothetical protein